MRLSKQIFIMVALPILIILGMGYFSYRNMEVLSGYTTKMYKHPFTVSNEIRNVKIALKEIDYKLMDFHMNKDKKKREAILLDIKAANTELEKSLEIIEVAFLGDKAQIDKLKNSYRNWYQGVISYATTWNLATYNNVVGKTSSISNQIEDILNFANDKAQSFYNDTNENSQQALWEFIILLSGTVTFLIFFSFLLGRSLYGRLNAITKKLELGADIVKNEACDISQSSDTLSVTTSESASSLQETASSMEELSAMVKNNVGQAENSRELAQLMRDSSKDVYSKTQELVDSMKEITESNNELEKLVHVIEAIADKTKLIDDIVFQTKILSFNASVEAEKAGEYGKGFSVVAQEVSNLAKLSGQASTDISSIVKDSVRSAQELVKTNRQKVDHGNQIVGKTAEFVQDITKNSDSIYLSTEQILSASQDQAAGISQINEAINQLDQSTQKNASLSTQSATASLELKKQAGLLSTVVSELSMLLNGKKESESSKQQEEKSLANENVVEFSSFSQKEEFVEAAPQVFKKAASDADNWEDI